VEIRVGKGSKADFDRSIISAAKIPIAIRVNTAEGGQISNSILQPLFEEQKAVVMIES
jgi:hypothetical protein